MLSRLRNNGPADLGVIINYYANSSLTINPLSKASCWLTNVNAPVDELHVKEQKKERKIEAMTYS